MKPTIKNIREGPFFKNTVCWSMMATNVDPESAKNLFRIIKLFGGKRDYSYEKKCLEILKVAKVSPSDDFQEIAYKAKDFHLSCQYLPKEEFIAMILTSKKYNLHEIISLWLSN